MGPATNGAARMTIFGIDVSSYQGGIDLGEVAREGFTFVIIKATEGGGYTNPHYAAQLAAAQKAGLLTVSYHFVHSADEAGQIRRLEATVPRGTPVILDAEVDGAGEYPVTFDLARQVTAAGWPVVGVYFPRWFWEQIGSPSLVGLGALWSSAYPGGSGAASAIYAAAGGDAAADWAGYGGLRVAIWQFTDKATVAGLAGVDASAFRGTREEFAALLQGDDMPSADDVARAVLDFALGTDADGNTVTLSRVIQDLGLNSRQKIAAAVLDTDLSGKNNGATLSLAAQAITGGTAMVKTASVTIDPAVLAEALTAAMAKAGLVDVKTAERIVANAIANLTLKAA
jgi:hypothetical protein